MTNMALGPQKNIASTINWLSQKWVPWFLLGIVLRLLLIPFSLHIDLRFIGDLVAMNQFYNACRTRISNSYTKLRSISYSLYAYNLQTNL